MSVEAPQATNAMSAILRFEPTLLAEAVEKVRVASCFGA